MEEVTKSLGANWRTVLLALIVVSLACAPVSWIDDGLTPSWIIYPLILLVGLWRMWRGHGTLYFGITGTIFLLVHIPVYLGGTLRQPEPDRGCQTVQPRAMAHHAFRRATANSDSWLFGLAGGPERSTQER